MAAPAQRLLRADSLTFTTTAPSIQKQLETLVYDSSSDQESYEALRKKASESEREQFFYPLEHCVAEIAKRQNVDLEGQWGYGQFHTFDDSNRVKAAFAMAIEPNFCRITSIDAAIKDLLDSLSSDEYEVHDVMAEFYHNLLDEEKEHQELLPFYEKIMWSKEIIDKRNGGTTWLGYGGQMLFAEGIQGISDALLAVIALKDTLQDTKNFEKAITDMSFDEWGETLNKAFDLIEKRNLKREQQEQAALRSKIEKQIVSEDGAAGAPAHSRSPIPPGPKDRFADPSSDMSSFGLDMFDDTESLPGAPVVEEEDAVEGKQEEAGAHAHSRSPIPTMPERLMSPPPLEDTELPSQAAPLSPAKSTSSETSTASGNSGHLNEKLENKRRAAISDDDLSEPYPVLKGTPRSSSSGNWEQATARRRVKETAPTRTGIIKNPGAGRGKLGGVRFKDEG